MQIEQGRELGRYRIVEKLGEGGMGIVWKALDTSLDREVAIKILPQTVAGDAERLARFDREAKVLASLSHPGIATIHGFEEAEGARFLVMELVEGEDLAERLSRGPMPIDVALAAGVQLADALEVAHEQSIIHRDLKPANIKITDDDKVKVLDFGLAKALDPEISQPSGSVSMSPTVTTAGTMAGVILGTAAYMSPEQAKGKPVDRRSDIWAFGVVLHQMLTGRKLFHGDSISETLAAVIMGEPDLDALPPNTPLRVRRLLERCLRKDPQSRLRDIGDARLVLEEALAGHEWKSPQIAETPQRRRSMGLMIGLVLAALVVGAVAGLMLERGQAPGPGPTRRLSIVSDAPRGMRPFIASDGSAVAYATREGIRVRSLDSYDEITLEGSERSQPVFSPDGRWIAFRRGVEVFKVPVDGASPPVRVGEYPRSVFGEPVWTPGDRIVGISNEPFTVMSLPADGGSATVVDIGGNEFGQNIFSAVNPLPDERHILAAADTFSDDGWQMNVVLVDIDSGEARILVEDAVVAALAPTGHLLFSRKETLLAVPFDAESFEVRGGPVALMDGLWVPAPQWSAWFSLSAQGTLVYRTGGSEFTQQLVNVDREGNATPWSEERRDYSRALEVSADGRLLAAHITNWDQGLEEIWISDFDRPRLQPFIDEPGLDCMNPVLSPDAEYLYYNCNGRGDVGGIHRRRTDGSTDPELLMARTSEDETLLPRDVTPDGRFLLLNRAGADGGVMLLPVEADADGRHVPQTLMDDALDYFNGPRLSPDGAWIAYQKNETGRSEIYIRPLRADGTLGQKMLASSDGGFTARWARTPPGQPLELLYRRSGKLLSVEIATRPSLIVSEPREVLDLREHRANLIEPLPDGRLLFAQAPEAELDKAVRVSVVLDWFDELERIAD
jgi:serine/threonine-protein kinase